MGTWNGLSLQGELSALLSDESTAFKARVSQWIRDIELDMCVRHHWPFLRNKGKKIMTVGSEEQSLLMASSTAPTVVIASGGSLSGTTYKIRVTFYEGVGKVESFQGEESDSVTATAINKTIDVTDIPVSDNELVTARKIYLSKDGGDYYYHSTISDNTTTTASISTDTTSKIEPPDFDYIYKLDGELFIEGIWQLKSDSIQTLRQAYSQDFSNTLGTPFTYATMSENKVLVYNAPSNADNLSYYYFKLPMGIYPSADSIPTIPIKLKQVLVAGVEWKGYQYRDRDGKDNAEKRYETLLRDAISKYSAADRNSYKVRDVTGNSDGFLIN